MLVVMPSADILGMLANLYVGVPVSHESSHRLDKDA